VQQTNQQLSAQRTISLLSNIQECQAWVWVVCHGWEVIKNQVKKCKCLCLTKLTFQAWEAWVAWADAEAAAAAGKANIDADHTII
jgi:hypothetical protein